MGRFALDRTSTCDDPGGGGGDAPPASPRASSVDAANEEDEFALAPFPCSHPGCNKRHANLDLGLCPEHAPGSTESGASIRRAVRSLVPSGKSLRHASNVLVVGSVTAVMALLEVDEKSTLALLACSAFAGISAWLYCKIGPGAMAAFQVSMLATAKHFHGITYVIEGMERTGARFDSEYAKICQDASVSEDTGGRSPAKGISRRRGGVDVHIGPLPVDGSHVRQIDELASYTALYATCARLLEPYRTQVLEPVVQGVHDGLAAASAKKSIFQRKSILGKKSFMDLWDDETVKLVGPNIKAVGRCQEKVRKEYSGDITRLKDVLRATIIVPGVDALELVHEELTAIADGDEEDVATHASAGVGVGTTISVKIAGLKNRYYSPSLDVAGYRDCNYSLIIDNCLVVELQVQIKAFAEIKEEAHAAYETARSLGLMGDMPGQGLDDLDDLEEEADREPPVATRHLLSMALRFTASFLALLLAFLGGWFGQLMYNYDLETNKVPKLAWALLFMIPLSVVGSLHFRAMFSNAASDCEAAGLAAAWIFCMAAYLSLGFMGFAGSAPNVSTDSLSGYHMSVTLPCAVICVWMLCRSRVSCCHRPRGTKSSRISLLYQRMFGVHGTHFGYKVLFAQAGTIILQSTSRLSLLGAAPLIQDGGYFNGIYWDAKTWFWVFFGVLLVNALYPSVILHAKAITVQRDLALYIDLILDFLYLIVPTYVGQSYDMSTMPVPR